MGERVTDVSLVHFMRPQTIKISATQLRPNTRVYIFFDNIDIKEYCTFNKSGTYVNFVGNFPKTDKNGNIEILFNLPSNKFRTGEKIFVITDNQANDKTDINTTMYATAAFAASGLSVTKETSTTTVRDFKFNNTETLEERTVRSRELQYLYSFDPLAQTFFVNEELYPDGVYVDSLDLCFSTKDPVIPVKVELRPTVNGYPDINRVYPNGVAVVNATDVRALNDVDALPDINDSNKFTKFTFDAPVYLSPGEHSFVVRSTSREYALYAAKLGDRDVRNENLRVLENPYLGVFFRSANASTWEPDGTTDLMFKMNKLIFDSTASPQNPATKTFTLKVDPSVAADFNNTFENGDGNLLTFNTYNLALKAVDYPNCRVNYSVDYYEGSANIDTINVPLNTDVVLGNAGALRKANPEQPFKILVNTTLTNPHISPIFDLEKSGVLFIRNMIDVSEIGSDGKATAVTIQNETLPFAAVKQTTTEGKSPATMRYMTRKITLAPGFDASNVKVLLTVYKPQGTDIAVFVKTQGSSSSGQFENQPYVQLTRSGNDFTSLDEEDYREIEYQFPQDVPAFDKFSIKICLFSNNSCNVPKVKDMRGIAVQ